MENIHPNKKYRRHLSQEESDHINEYILKSIKKKINPFFVSKKRLNLNEHLQKEEYIRLKKRCPTQRNKAGDKNCDQARSKNEESIVFLDRIRAVHKRALSHVDQSLKKQEKRTLRKNKGRRPLKTVQSLKFDYQNALISPRNAFYPGLQDEKNSLAFTERQRNGNLFQIIHNQGNFIDYVDLQFRQGLVEQLYTKERLRFRKKMNENQWKKRKQYQKDLR